MAAATNQSTLRGSCACGRIRYTIDIPTEQTELAELKYDNTNATRNHSANPLTLWLRVPLTWYTSATFAQFPDEHHAGILRTFTSPFAVEAHSRRQFCGYCGTQLTSWHERTADDANHICLTVGSLLDEDQVLLGQLGYLPGADSGDEDTEHGLANAGRHARMVTRSEPLTRGAPWFEELIEHTALGRYTKRRGGHQSRDGAKVEWEVVEWTEGDDLEQEGSTTPSKRKIGQVDAGEDAEMRIL
ncbi:hypothetical protein DM02DRAFT_639094 [Periconia macrospinosa]|uniref:CENP-V/GFA domain-containing protein n=1 Tax=Periconia macrospinosa TaxID=97972 RepID=A0A2V1E8V0_9PLEO|nr:hypothetical protein DM02DRAFT_639094 [Periconia macrospinosa]